MTFRFGSALVLAILIAVAGVAIEKRCLELRRALIAQRYRQEALRDLVAQLRLKTQQLGAPTRVFEEIAEERIGADAPNFVDEIPAERQPLLSWQRGGSKAR